MLIYVDIYENRTVKMFTLKSNSTTQNSLKPTIQLKINTNKNRISLHKKNLLQSCCVGFHLNVQM